MLSSQSETRPYLSSRIKAKKGSAQQTTRTCEKFTLLEPYCPYSQGHTQAVAATYEAGGDFAGHGAVGDETDVQPAYVSDVTEHGSTDLKEIRQPGQCQGMPVQGTMNDLALVEADLRLPQGTAENPHHLLLVIHLLRSCAGLVPLGQEHAG